ncbi:MAG: hypothetical protein IT235_07755 [Bacteroidia bacterium]|nr:hypothetical protein [Bacteroidia bacterium]
MPRLKTYFLSATFLWSFYCFPQTADDQDSVSAPPKSLKGFHAGLFVGSYFANKYTARLYDGYGYDYNSNKNDFANSWMNRKINYEYGGGNGQPDRIATALNVNHGSWSFSESDMPINLKYNIAILLGANTRYCFNNLNAIVFNVYASKLTVSGNFTITLNTAQVNTTMPGYTNTKTFSIMGNEQRLLFQAGYQRIIGDEDSPLNCFVEIGPSLSMAKFDKNQILINTLQIDITTQYNPIGYVTYRAKNLTGVGFGVFGGLGINLNANAKWTLQLLYTPSYDKINIGADAKSTLQHAAGLRAYYNF